MGNFLYYTVIQKRVLGDRETNEKHLITRKHSRGDLKYFQLINDRKQSILQIQHQIYQQQRKMKKCYCAAHGHHQSFNFPAGRFLKASMPVCMGVLKHLGGGHVTHFQSSPQQIWANMISSFC